MAGPRRRPEPHTRPKRGGVGFTQGRNGNKHPKRTTKGREIAVELMDGLQVWMPMKDVKDRYPIDVAEYAVARGIEDEPAFHWWVPCEEKVLEDDRKVRNSIAAFS